MTRIIAILVLISTVMLAPDRTSVVQDQGGQDRTGVDRPKSNARQDRPATPPTRDRTDDRQRSDTAHRRFGPPWRTGERRSDASREFGRWDRTGPRDFTLDHDRKKLILEVVNDLRPLSDQDRQRLLAMPDDDLRKLLTGDASRIFYLSRLRQFDPTLYELKIRELRLSQELVRLARQYRHLRAAQSADADAVQTKIRKKVSEQYDIRLATREHEITQLERRVESMRTRIEQERSQRKSIVDRWMADLDRPDDPPQIDRADVEKQPPARSSDGE